MRPGFLSCSLILSLTVTACSRRAPLSVAPAEARPATVRLDFQPPVDRVLTETQRSVRSVERGGQALREEVELSTRTRFTPSEGGWLLAQSVPSSRLWRNGQEVPTGVADVLARFTLRAWLAADGTFVKLVEPEAAQEALRQVVPGGSEAGVLERFFAPEALEARARREWEVKFSGLLQRNLTEGHVSWAVDQVPMGDSQVAYVLERTVQGTRGTPLGDAVVLSLRCLDALPEDAPDALTDVWVMAGRPELTPGVACEGEQVVARGRFVPVSRQLTVRATVAGEAWTVTTESRAEGLQEEAR
ncbi:putative lipoprotein [Myxococcus hansupus]|uniref:Putative lipoprotein n=1 Tax=Pseudomyxococcus hansupus TaxID=1297742 RepID=A0A0H4WZA0_9BACT|nr:hypothetical protein [Myxococcus hansupus]AKQ68114.1 putative lipoprotein [Myxococcus hansupus]